MIKKIDNDSYNKKINRSRYATVLMYPENWIKESEETNEMVKPSTY